jgi:hypothetical protein
MGNAVNPTDPEKSDLYLVPTVNPEKITEVFGTKVTGWNKLDFEKQNFQGIDGYKIFTELLRAAHRVVDGLPQNTTLYPGVKAAGTVIEILPPLKKSVSVSLQVRPKDGVTLNSISELIKSTTAGYINGLGTGKPIIISEIIRTVQSLPGVLSVKVLTTSPAYDDDRIIVADSEKAVVLNASTDISIG